MSGHRIYAAVATTIVAVLPVGGAAGSGSGEVIFRDDFSSSHSGWATGVDRIGSTSYRSGGYWVLVRKRVEDTAVGNDLKKIVTRASMQLDVTERRGGAGDEVAIVCFENVDRDRGYYFAIGPGDAFYAIRRTNTVKRTKQLIHGFDPHAIHSLRVKNRLRAECTGAGDGQPATLTFYVNGRFVAQVRDPKGYARFAGIGLDLLSKKGGSLAVFDNALARER